MIPYYAVKLFHFDIYNLYLLKLKIFNLRENIHVDVAKIHSLNCDEKYQSRYCIAFNRRYLTLCWSESLTSH